MNIEQVHALGFSNREIIYVIWLLKNAVRTARHVVKIKMNDPRFHLVFCESYTKTRHDYSAITKHEEVNGISCTVSNFCVSLTRAWLSIS
jgi:hypothetical protein